MSNVAVVEPRPNLMVGGRVGAIIPQTMDETYRLAKAVCMAGMAPKGMDTPEKCMIAMMRGMEVGLTPFQALDKIAVVNGRPVIWGDGAMALVRGSGLCEWIKEYTNGAGNERVAWCEAKRRGDQEIIRRTFSVADAKQAGLWAKQGPWTQYPERMLQMRARAFTLRDGFADVLGGLYLKEEFDGVDGRASVIPTPPTPPTPPPSPVRAQLVASVAMIEKAASPPAGFDFEAYRKSLQDCETIAEMNAVFDNIVDKARLPDDEIEECQRILSEIAEPLWKGDSE
jgi:hypothetical protein